MSAEARAKDYAYERDKALSSLDLVWVRQNVKLMRHASDEVVLMTIHKARYEATGVEPKLRHNSREWLQRRGLRRLVDEFLTEDQLP